MQKEKPGSLRSGAKTATEVSHSDENVAAGFVFRGFVYLCFALWMFN